MGSLLAGIILFLTVSSSLFLGILAAYGAISGIIYLFAQRSGVATSAASTTATPAKAMQAAASAGGD